jgi:hypothetical protein
MGIVADLKTRRGARELFGAAFLSRTVDLNLVLLVHFGTAMPEANIE